MCGGMAWNTGRYGGGWAGDGVCDGAPCGCEQRGSKFSVEYSGIRAGDGAHTRISCAEGQQGAYTFMKAGCLSDGGGPLFVSDG